MRNTIGVRPPCLASAILMTTEMKLKLIQVVTYLFIYTSKQAINSSNKICDVIRCNKYIYVEYVSNNIKYIYMVQIYIYIYMTQVYIDICFQIISQIYF